MRRIASRTTTEGRRRMSDDYLKRLYTSPHKHNEDMWAALKEDAEKVLELVSLQQNPTVRLIQDGLIAGIGRDQASRQKLESLRTSPAVLDSLKECAEKVLA